MKKLFTAWSNIRIVNRIIGGLLVGILLAIFFPNTSIIGILGDLFVGALKSIAPVLVLFLVIAALCKNEAGTKTNMKRIVFLYLLGTFVSGLVAVAASFLSPVTLLLSSAQTQISPPEGIQEVLQTLLKNMVSNPIHALLNANYIGILCWAILLGLALKTASATTKTAIQEIANAVSQLVSWIIEFAPFGVMGLMFQNISQQGFAALGTYAKLIILLVGTMLFVALVVNPFIAWVALRKNPYPLVLKCLKESGVTAFFTRSSAANIPVNMRLCEELGLNSDTYAVSIPLGATINMGGAAITISILSLAAANTLGIQVDFLSAVTLSILSAISACGASGVAGGSLLLVPLACSLFGIPNEIAMQVVGVGFVVGVIQDSCETAINSSTDVLYTAVAELSQKEKK